MSPLHRFTAGSLALAFLTFGMSSTAGAPKRNKPKPAKAASAKKNKPVDESGPQCLLILCREAGVKATLPELKRLCRVEGRRATLADLERGALAKGLNVAIVRMEATTLERQQGSGIAWIGRTSYVAFGPAAGKQAWLEDPVRRDRRIVSYAEIVGRAQGLVLLHVRSRLRTID